MLTSHVDSLAFNYNDKMLKTFDKPKLEGDSVTSVSMSKKIAFITRHLLTGEPTHSLVLQGDHFDRL